MKAVLLVPETKRAGLTGKPLLNKQGMVSSIKGSFTAGQNVAICNLTGIKAKLQEANEAILKAESNITITDSVIERIESQSEQLAVTTLGGDYWSRWLRNDISNEYSNVQMIATANALDRSRERLLGESVDAYPLENVASSIILPHGFWLTEHFPPVAGVIPNYNSYAYTKSSTDYKDNFGYKVYMDGYTIGVNRVSGRPGNQKVFYGPVHKNPETIENQRNQCVFVAPLQEYWTYIDDPYTGLPTQRVRVVDFYWNPTSGYSKYIYSMFLPSGAAGSYFSSNIATVYLNRRPNSSGQTRTFLNTDDADIISIDLPVDAEGKLTTGSPHHYTTFYYTHTYARYESQNGGGAIGPYAYAWNGPDYWAAKYGLSSRDWNYGPYPVNPSQGVNYNQGYIYGVFTENGTLEQSKQYNLTTSFAKYNKNLYNVKSTQIGGRVIVATWVWRTIFNFNRGIYVSCMVLVQCQGESQPRLLLERNLVQYYNGSGAKAKTVEQVIYNFNPSKQVSDFLTSNNKGKITEIIINTFDGHTIDYRGNVKEKDNMLGNEYVNTEVTFDQFYAGY